MEIRGVRVKKKNKSARKGELFVLRPPEYFAVPILAHGGESPLRAVNVGEKVKEGSLIGRPDGRYGSYVYSPCAGRVVGVVKKLNASGNESEHIIIARDPGEEKELLPVLDALEQDQERLLKRLYESGMFDTFAPFEPAYKKYLLKTEIKSLVVNCVEDDPYQNCQSALICAYASEIVEGARMLAKICNAQQIVFAITYSQNEVEHVLRTHLRKLNAKNIFIKRLPDIYPMQDARLMAYHMTGKMVPEGSRTAQVGVIVDNAVNCYDFYNAVAKGEVCTQRPVTIAGNNIIRKGNYFVKNGTGIDHILKIVGLKETAIENMLIYGGIMSGIAQETTDISLALDASMLLFCNNQEYVSEKETPCIACGKCNAVCPVRLNVKKLDDLIVDREYAAAKAMGVQACIGCGACSYVCPAKRYLAQRMAFAKEVSDGKRGKRPSSSDYLLIAGEDLTKRGVNLTTEEKEIDESKNAARDVDDMLNILSKKTEEEEKKQDLAGAKPGVAPVSKVETKAENKQDAEMPAVEAQKPAAADNKPTAADKKPNTTTDGGAK